jgi:signal transduction histidine kinase
MSNNISIVWPRFPLLYLTTYLTLVTVALFELAIMPVADTHQSVIGLLLVFGVLLVAQPFFKVFSWQNHLYLALQTSVVISLLLLRPGSLMLPMLFCVLSVTAPLSLSLRSAAVWIITFALINTCYCGFSDYKDEHSWMVSLPYTVGYIFCATAAYSLARSSAARRRSEALLAELQTTHQQLQEYAGRVEELAVSQERNRLAREMHDTLGHRLTVAAVQLEGAERLIPTEPTRAARMVNTVRQEVVEALAELRRTVATLRTPLDADLSLPVALTRLVTGFEDATGVKVNWLLPAELPPLPNAYRLALYRVAQEALTNVQRHAQAEQVWLELALEQEVITLLVKDDGQGFIPETNPIGFGLRGLRERAVHLNGEFHLDTNPGAGTQICFHLPLPQDEDTPQLITPAKPGRWKLKCPFDLYPLKQDESATLSQPSTQPHQI